MRLGEKNGMRGKKEHSGEARTARETERSR